VTTAEDAAESFNRTNVNDNYTFYSAKDSYIAGDTEQSENLDNSTFTPMELHPDSRFYNIPVNLNYSIVHVPTNIYYGGILNLGLLSFWSLTIIQFSNKNVLETGFFPSSGEIIGGTCCVDPVRRS
jgi:hypothetical protein